ncbi:penicillin-binding protein 1C [Ampullimonas aquatilis]|uniref:penicillin-binding protein 1C n=1 Tax=Ampullimonas aquatilis TaxID=1341549 RepID=UPI003C707EDC
MLRSNNYRIVLIAFIAMFLSVLLIAVLDRTFPLHLPRPDGGMVVLAEDGSPLRTYPSRDGIWRQPVTPEQVSPLYLQALLNYEDRWFYWHPGVNPVALLRAAWQWVRYGHIVSGGSTLTMQVARRLDWTTGAENADDAKGSAQARRSARSLTTKLRQIARALQLEWHLSKREILILYVNHAPMGGIVEGVEMASRAYLGKSAQQLSHADVALLACLPQAPSRLRPDRAPRLAQAARDKVLARMVTLGVWDAATVADARIERVIAQPIRSHWLAPLAAERLRQTLRDSLRKTVRKAAPQNLPKPRPAQLDKTSTAPPLQANMNEPAEQPVKQPVANLLPVISGTTSAATVATTSVVTSNTAAATATAMTEPVMSSSFPTTAHRIVGGVITLPSTLHADMQSALEQLLVDRLQSLPPHISMAALIMDNESLAIRAYAGSADFSDNTRFAHVDMVRGVRSPGSTLKPFLYAMALDEGLIHSESLLMDVPQSFAGYAPGNFQANFSGPVSVSEALQRSLNVPAVDMLDQLGPMRFAAHLRAGGLHLRLPKGSTPNLSLILGGAGTTLEELVGSYRALAYGGVAGTPRLSPSAPKIETRLMSEGAAFIIRDILETGGRPDAPFQEGLHKVAWKTGTSFGFRDAWAIGVTDNYTLGVWVGRPDGTPNPGFFGANTAAPLLKDLLAILPVANGQHHQQPASVQAATICWPLGLRIEQTTSEHCQARRSAWLLHDTAPPTRPDRLRAGNVLETIWLNPATGLRVTPRCMTDRIKTVVTPGNASVVSLAKDHSAKDRLMNGNLSNASVANSNMKNDPAATTGLQQLILAHWPMQLEPWLEPAQLKASRGPDWQVGCAPDQPGQSLRIEGVDSNSLIQPAPGQTRAVLTVHALGSQQSVVWLLNGQQVGSTDKPQAAFKLSLEKDDRYTLTALDEQGRYARVVFKVSGLGR